MFECSKTGDYHESMDARHFEEWFEKVLVKMQRNDVIVMDNASYHSRYVNIKQSMLDKSFKTICTPFHLNQFSGLNVIE